MDKMVKLVLGYLSFYKRKTIGIIFVLGLAFASFCIVNVTCKNINIANYNKAGMDNGKQYFSISNPEEELVQNLKKEKVEKLGQQWVLGQDEISYKKEMIYLYNSRDFDALENNYAHISKGRKPKKSNEIAVTASLLKEQGIHLGDEISTTIEKVDYKKGIVKYTEKRAFQIVGVMEDTDDQKICHVAVVSEELLEEFQGKYGIRAENLDVTLSDNQDIDSQISDLIEKYQLNDTININHELIQAVDSMRNMNIMNAGILICIVLVVGLTVSNLIYFTFIYNIKDYGVMKCIGMENSFIYRVILVNVAFYMVPAIIIGALIAGIVIRFEGGIIGNLLSITDGQMEYMDLVKMVPASDLLMGIGLLVIALIPSCMIPMIQIKKMSPVEIVREGRQKIISWKHPYLDKIIYHRNDNKMKIYAMKNILRNFKRTLLTLAIILFSMLLISGITAEAVTEQEAETAIREVVPGDIYIQSENYMENASGFDTAYPEEVLSSLKETEGIECVDACAMKEMMAYLDVKNIRKEHKAYQEENNKTSFYLEDLTAYGVTNVEDYFVESDESDGCEVVITEDEAKFWNLEVGDEFEVSLFQEDIENAPRICLKVNNIIEQGKFVTESTGSIVYLKYDDMKKLFQSKGYDRFDIYVKKTIEPAVIKVGIEAMDSFKEDTTVESFSDMAKEYEQSQFIQKRIKGIFVFVLVIISGVGCVDAIYTGIMNRRVEMINLYAVGIQKKDLCKNVVYEGGCYAKVVFLLLLPIQLMVVVGTCFMNCFDSKLPVCYVLMDLGAYLLCAIAALAAGKKLMKNMDINELKCE